MPRTASHLRRPGDAGTYGARSARAEHPEAKAAGAQIFHFQLQIRRGERVVVEPPRRKAHFERARSGRQLDRRQRGAADRKSTRLNSSHVSISYAVFCLKKKKIIL